MAQFAKRIAPFFLSLLLLDDSADLAVAVALQ